MNNDDTYSDEQRKTMLAVAEKSIVHGLRQGGPLSLDLADFDPVLREKGASFVTLNKNGQLRGCIGTLMPYQPLIQDIADHAYAAAFEDSRFSALGESELEQIDIHISILTPAIPMHFESEADLLEQLKPGEDGLILEYHHHRATFLPMVWDSLPQAQDFLNQLKLKAGLAAEFWSPDIRIKRYTTISVP